MIRRHRILRWYSTKTAPLHSSEIATYMPAFFEGARIEVRTESSDDESWISITASSTDEELESISTLNDRVAGWQFRIPQYKANQLTRRWDDILQAETNEE